MKVLKNQQGSAMILTLMVMVVLVILTTAILQFTHTEVLHGRIEEQSKQAYYLARTGAEAAVSIWLQQGASSKPDGKVKRVYFNAETNQFQVTEPAVSGGYFDVTIEKPDATEDPWRIISTGTVGKHSQTVSLITYPFSHGSDLGWYDENGKIEEGNFQELEEEFIFLLLDQGKTFMPEDKYYEDYHGSFSANTLVFASPLKIDLGDYNTMYNSTVIEAVNKTFTVEAESVYFDDVEVSYARPGSGSHWLYGSWSRTNRKGSLVLQVPEGQGIPYNEVGGTYGHIYGKVYFDGNNVKRQEYQWNRRIQLLIAHYFYVTAINNGAQITNTNGEALAGNSYYFRHGTDLLNIMPGDLIPFTDDTERPPLRGIKPYYWE